MPSLLPGMTKEKYDERRRRSSLLSGDDKAREKSSLLKGQSHPDPEKVKRK